MPEVGIGGACCSALEFYIQRHGAAPLPHHVTQGTTDMTNWNLNTELVGQRGLAEWGVAVPAPPQWQQGARPGSPSNNVIFSLLWAHAVSDSPHTQGAELPRVGNRRPGSVSVPPLAPHPCHCLLPTATPHPWSLALYTSLTLISPFLINTWWGCNPGKSSLKIE